MFTGVTYLYLILAALSGGAGALHGTLLCPLGITVVGVALIFNGKKFELGVMILALYLIVLTWLAFGITKLFM